MIQNLSIILGNQLVLPALIQELTRYPIFMCESDDLCRHFKYHKLKLLFYLTAMRHYRDELISHHCDCFYHPLHPNHQQTFIDVLTQFCQENQTQTIHMLEIEDQFFESKINSFCQKNHIKRITYPSPLFLTSNSEFKDYLTSVKKPFMKTFYERQRKKLSILVENNQPIGGQWSFDEQNRKKTPKSIQLPSAPTSYSSSHREDICELIKIKFNDHIGSSDSKLYFPVMRSDVTHWLNQFIKERLSQFGDYEDAIDTRSDLLFHSGLSAMMNCGLLTPNEIINELQSYHHDIPLNSLEGFYRQIIGWREFIRGIYHHYHEQQSQMNFFNHHRKLTDHWYNGTTGITPLDDAIKQVIRLGYTHHINRLMVIGNAMLLCQIHPHEVYRWFMECFIDSADWVMGPNVFGMSQFSDGGIFATKPYFCGSNYIRKMSHYPKKEWCDTLDALFWRFIDDQQLFLAKNYRMKMMVSKLNKFDSKKIAQIHKLSNDFIHKVTKL